MNLLIYNLLNIQLTSTWINSTHFYISIIVNSMGLLKAKRPVGMNIGHRKVLHSRNKQSKLFKSCWLLIGNVYWHIVKKVVPYAQIMVNRTMSFSVNLKVNYNINAINLIKVHDPVQYFSYPSYEVIDSGEFILVTYIWWLSVPKYLLVYLNLLFKYYTGNWPSHTAIIWWIYTKWIFTGIQIRYWPPLGFYSSTIHMLTVFIK